MLHVARLAAVLAVLLVACESDTPTDSEPETPGTPQPIQAANVTFSGASAWVDCSIVDQTNPFARPPECAFQADARNIGAGCAASIRGVTRLYDSNARQVGGSLSWERLSTVRPNELFVYRTQRVPPETSQAVRSYTTEATWTNVRC